MLYGEASTVRDKARNRERIARYDQTVMIQYVREPTFNHGAVLTIMPAISLTSLAKTVRLGKLVDRGITQLAYTYDFGDDWRHTITIEAIADAVEHRECR